MMFTIKQGQKTMFYNRPTLRLASVIFSNRFDDDVKIEKIKNKNTNFKNKYTRNVYEILRILPKYNYKILIL